VDAANSLGGIAAFPSSCEICRSAAPRPLSPSPSPSSARTGCRS